MIRDGSSKEVDFANVQAGFEIKDVSFVYPSRPEVTVLDNVNMTIPPLKHTAIVGLSGSGKSTIASLVARLYDPTQGEVLFAGQDLRDLSLSWLRSFIALVQQEPSLLDRSILENIAHGLINSSQTKHSHLKETLLGPQLGELASQFRDGKDLSDLTSGGDPNVAEIMRLVQEAASLADAHQFVEKLQHGYGTIVGSNGRLLSGGQRQRVALARALVKDPAVLVLDEATSALDSKTERQIQDSVSKIASSRTVISIAHRLSTISTADNIIVMHKGLIQEQGTHAELMAKGGAYANLVGLQTMSGKTEDNEDRSVISDESSSSINGDAEKVNPVTEETPVADASEEEPAPVSEGSPKGLWSVVSGYGPALRPHLLVVGLALIASVIVGGSFSGEAVIFGNTVSDLNPCKTPESVRSSGSFFGLMFLVLAIIEFFANIVSWSGFGWVSEKMVYTVRVLSFRSLFEQSLQWHQDKGRTPSLLLSYITRDGDALAGLSGSVIGTLFSITVNLVAATVLAHIIAWKIALVCLAVVPLLLGTGFLELRILGKFEERQESSYAKSVEIGTEAITSIKTVAALSLQDEIVTTYRRSLDGPRKETFQVTWQASLCQAMTYFFGNTVNALAYWWGSKQIIAGTYTQTQFLIVVFSLLVSAMLWSQMFALAPELTNAFGAMDRLLGLIEIGSDKMQGSVKVDTTEYVIGEKDVEATKRQKSSVPGSRQGSSIEFRDVHFAYPARPNAEVLSGLNISVPAGSFSALVGPSGAGKSTIISLVERLYMPKSGAVLVNGVDVTRQQGVVFREDISLVPQESTLFSGTIEFNVALGARPGQKVTKEQIEEACKLANIHDVIMGLPDGYQTLCGPNGNQFSGGQKQRLSIARALIREPKLLILDEPTSALDAQSEKLLQDGLDKAAKGITVIAIAHRLNTIRKADRIFLIEGGKCVDQGSHEELMARSLSYKTNVMHQTIAE